MKNMGRSDQWESVAHRGSSTQWESSTHGESVAHRVAEEKRVLRRQVLALRGSLTREERRRGSLLLTERLLGHQWFYLSEAVLGFVGFGSEIDTGEFLQEALRMGKRVYVPRVEGNAMNFYQIQGLEELAEGYRGIPEPVGGTKVYRYLPGDQALETGEVPPSKTLMLMPGVAFDRYGNRMGYGRGYYDRFLADKEELALRTIGVGFSCQLVERVPAEEHDIRPCQVICL